MGADCAALVADLFLFAFEFIFVKTNLPLAGSLVGHKSDLFTINISEYTSKIYPNEVKEYCRSW